MSNYKSLTGHSIADGSGRDTYIKCRPNSEAYTKPSSKLILGIQMERKRRRKFRPELVQPSIHVHTEADIVKEKSSVRPVTEYKPVFVPETSGNMPYLPTAKSYWENKSRFDALQKIGDQTRFTIRPTDQMRREIDEKERLLKLARLNVTVDPKKALKRMRLHKCPMAVARRTNLDAENVSIHSVPQDHDLNDAEVQGHKQGHRSSEDVLEAFIEKLGTPASRTRTAIPYIHGSHLHTRRTREPSNIQMQQTEFDGRKLRDAKTVVPESMRKSSTRETVTRDGNQGLRLSRTALRDLKDAQIAEERTGNGAERRSITRPASSLDVVRRPREEQQDMPRKRITLPLQPIAGDSRRPAVPRRPQSVGREDGEWVWIKVPSD